MLNLFPWRQPSSSTEGYLLYPLAGRAVGEDRGAVDQREAKPISGMLIGDPPLGARPLDPGHQAHGGINTVAVEGSAEFDLALQDALAVPHGQGKRADNE